MGLLTRGSKSGAEEHWKYDKKKDKLGSGNFATVYRCEKKDPKNKRWAEEDKKDIPSSAAVKVIDKAKVDDMDDVMREVEIMNKTKHDNIVQMYEVFELAKTYTIVMELVTGGELFDAIVNRGNYTEKDAAKVMQQMCSALDYLHELKIVHRDLKPENVLLKEPQQEGKEDLIKIADFGLARFTSGDSMMKTACGTPGYVAPEVLQNKGYSSGAVDMWSTGVILYILLCGFPPFYEEELPALFDQILKARYDFPSPWWDEISGGAKNLVKGLLTIKPEKRLTAKAIVNAGASSEDWAKWMHGHAPNTSLAAGQNQLKKFQAAKKLKEATKKIMALHRIQKLGAN